MEYYALGRDKSNPLEKNVIFGNLEFFSGSFSSPKTVHTFENSFELLMY